MYNTFQKTQKITFTSHKVSIVDVVHHLRPWEAERQRSPRRECLCWAHQECFRRLENLWAELLLYPDIQKEKKKKE